VGLVGRGFVTVHKGGAQLSPAEVRAIVDDPRSWALSAHGVTVEITDAGARYL
jgi:hypothetical protein